MAEPMQPAHARRLLALLSQDSRLIVFELLLRTGIRTHELQALELRDDHVRVTAAKGSRDHIIPLEATFYYRLRDSWLRLKTDIASYGTYEAYKATLRQRWALYKQDHDWLKPYSLHSLRSAFAILIYTETKDIMLTKECLGHQSINSTMSYVRMSQIEAKRDEILKAVG